ncbi:MAG: efflux RND transporter periplasmic adaptor subunit [bacterium]|nr:efflux RND transporter periplasmic adaptor subunit [bacterium]
MITRILFDTQRGKYRLWLLPLVLLILVLVMFKLVGGKIQKNKVGKPEILVSTQHGRVQEVYVKPGDVIQPGKELVNFVVTDQTGKTGTVQERDEAVDVTVKTIAGEQFVDQVELPGITRAFLKCEVSAKVGGEIVEILVGEGRDIKKGDVIARIEKKDYVIALAQAQAAFDLAKLQYNRMQKLVKEKATAQSERDKAAADYQSASSALDRARLHLDRCDILAPVEGIVNRKYVEVGESIDSGKEVARILNIDKIKISIGIPEQDVSYVRNIKEMTFTIPSIGNRIFSGLVDHLSFSTSPIAKVYPLEIHVANEDHALLPGMVVKGRVVRKVYENAVLLPLFSVIPGDNEYYTFVYRDGRSEKREISLGTFQEKLVHILDGLKPGDRVIDKGLRLVADGTKVRIVE